MLKSSSRSSRNISALAAASIRRLKP
jgi:hypothetical protein